MMSGTMTVTVAGIAASITVSVSPASLPDSGGTATVSAIVNEAGTITVLESGTPVATTVATGAGTFTADLLVTANLTTIAEYATISASFQGVSSTTTATVSSATVSSSSIVATNISTTSLPSSGGNVSVNVTVNGTGNVIFEENGTAIFTMKSTGSGVYGDTLVYPANTTTVVEKSTITVAYNGYTAVVATVSVAAS